MIHNRRYQRIVATGILLLVALPMLLGFASPVLSSVHWNRMSGVILPFKTRGSEVLAPGVSGREEDGPIGLYRDSMEVLKNNYYGDPIDRHRARELTYAAIRGMLASLKDPFTGFLDPQQWRQMQQMTSGAFEGVGTILEPQGSQVVVVRVYDNSPAARAGLKTHDLILEVGRC